jgi:ubiquinone/menaquinone biosynthesis C-methylase UbiE
MRRSTELEWLDAPAHDAATLRGNLRDMARYDRRLGTFALTLSLATDELRDATTALDVGMGNGAFIMFAAARSSLKWSGVDASPAVLRIAREQCSAPLVAALGQRLPFPDKHLDVVTCANTLHHLDEGDAVTLLRECARVARQRMVIVDLARGRLTMIGAWLLTRLTSSNAMTRADGVQSARRAWTPQEAGALASQAGLAHARVRRQGLFHFSIVIAL